MTAEYQNFTIIGSPTIEDNGVVSDFAAGSYLQLFKLEPGANSFEFHITYNFEPQHDNYDVFLQNANGSDKGLTSVISSTWIQGIFNTEDSSYKAITVTNTSNPFVSGDVVYVIYGYDASTQKFYLSVKKNDIDWGSDEVTTTSTLRQTNAGKITLSANNPTSTRILSGSVNLNNIKFYINNNLVYQPYSSDFKLINRVYNRHDTASNFSTNNPVLGDGEVAVETDTSKIKIGDGTTAYNSLPYAGGSSTSYTAGEGIDITNNEISVDSGVLDSIDNIEEHVFATDTRANVTLAGAVTDNEGVLSNFGAENYGKVTDNLDLGTGEFEMVIDFTTSSDVSTDGQDICGRLGGRSIMLQVTGTYLRIWTSANGVDWSESSNNYIMHVSENTRYRIKIYKPNNTSSNNGLIYSYNFTTNAYELIRAYTIPNIVSGYPFTIGVAERSNFRGSVNCNYCYITVNGNMYWNGTKQVVNPNVNNFYTKSEAVASTTVRNIVSLTQTEYDNLQTVDANTFYVIIPASNS